MFSRQIAEIANLMSCVNQMSIWLGFTLLLLASSDYETESLRKSQTICRPLHNPLEWQTHNSIFYFHFFFCGKTLFNN